MANQPKVLAFAGSLRKESFNKKLIKIAVRGAEEEGAKVTYIDLKDYPLPVYDQEIEDAEGVLDNAIKLKSLFLEHDGFMIAAPEYNSSITAALKNAIDWVSRPASPEEVYLCAFIDKVVTLFSASPGQLGGLRALVTVRSIFTNINSIVLPGQKSMPLAHQAFSEDGNLKDPKQQNDVLNLAKQHVQFLKKYLSK